MCDFLK